MKKQTLIIYLVAFILLFFINIGIGILMAYLVYGQGQECVKVRAKRDVTETLNVTVKQSEECKHRTAPVKTTLNVFRSFTKAELARLNNFIKNKNLVSKNSYFYRTNFLLAISLYPLDKKEVDDYYENVKHNRTASPPDRYALVRIRRGARSKPDIMEYKIGPVNPNKNMTYKRLLTPGQVPLNGRTNDPGEFMWHYARSIQDLRRLNNLTVESFDGATVDKHLTRRLMDPPGIKVKDRQRRYSLNFRVPGTWLGFDLHQSPLHFCIDSSNLDPKKWRTHSYYYLNQGPYDSAYKLLEAYKNNQTRKIKLTEGYRSRLNQRVYPHKHQGKKRENADKEPPRSYYPQGPRYKISKDFISWMGWEFVYNIDYVRGPALHDVKFKGERILWELALSEVALVYGHDSSSANNILADTSFNLGGQLYRVFHNVECPDHGTIMNNIVIQRTAHRTIKATCVFEADGEKPLWRKKGEKFAGGLRESYLVVRTPVPVGNYDYTFEWHFHLDGSLKTMVHASGFLQAGFWDPENPHAGVDKTKDAFGFRISEYTHGAMHDHMFAYKVDLDVLGTNNTFKRLNWKAGPLANAYNHNGIPSKSRHHFSNETYYMHWQTESKEKGFEIDMQNPKRWVVVNENKKNKWGVYRGYELVHTETAAQSLSDSHPAMDGLSFTKYHCAVTKYNKTEMYATDSDLIGSFSSPRVSVDKYLNNERIVNEDLVLWVSVGFLHVPTAEDFPETMQTGAGFWLRPFNYFDENPVFDMPQYYESTYSRGCECERPPRFDSEPCHAYSRNV